MHFVLKSCSNDCSHIKIYISLNECGAAFCQHLEIMCEDIIKLAHTMSVPLYTSCLSLQIVCVRSAFFCSGDNFSLANLRVAAKTSEFHGDEIAIAL